MWHKSQKTRRPMGACGLNDFGFRKLPAVFVGHGEFLAGVATAGAKYAAAVGRGHSCAEAVLVDTLAAGRLERSFHDISFLYFRDKDCKGSKSCVNRKIIFQYEPAISLRTRFRQARMTVSRCE